MGQKKTLLFRPFKPHQIVKKTSLMAYILNLYIYSLAKPASDGSRGKIASASAIFVWPREENFKRQSAAFRAKPENKQTAQKFSWCWWWDLNPHEVALSGF